MTKELKNKKGNYLFLKGISLAPKASKAPKVVPKTQNILVLCGSLLKEVQFVASRKLANLEIENRFEIPCTRF